MHLRLTPASLGAAALAAAVPAALAGGPALALGLGSFGGLLLATGLPALLVGSGPGGAARRERLRTVRTSGAPLVMARVTAGRIGPWRTRQWLSDLSLAVHPGGVVLRAGLLGERSIAAGEIRSLRVREQRAGEHLASIEIAHDAIEIPSPVILWRVGEGPLADELRRLLAG